MPGRDIDVVAAGHICVDITPSFGELSGSTVAEILRPGKLVEVGSPTISTGGPVSNTGLTLRRLGLKVSLMGKCGEDSFGEMLLEVLREEAPGAEQGMSIAGQEETSYTLVLAPPGIDRIFLHCPGCNHTFGPEDVDARIVKDARLFHFGYPPLMRRMYESGGEELEQILREAREAGAVTSLDMALPDPDSPAGTADWGEILSRALPHADIFLPSLEELMFMLRRNRFDQLSARPGGICENFTEEDLRCLAGKCLSLGSQIVVIKCGHLGAYLRTGNQPQRMGRCLGRPEDWQQTEHFEPTCHVAQIASTTGAGDSSISGFLAAMLRGEDPLWCMASLTVVGAQNLSSRDAVSGVRSWAETVNQIESGPQKNPLPERLAHLR